MMLNVRCKREISMLGELRIMSSSRANLLEQLSFTFKVS